MRLWMSWLEWERILMEGWVFEYGGEFRRHGNVGVFNMTID
jgi:hypothetical protein